MMSRGVLRPVGRALVAAAIVAVLSACSSLPFGWGSSDAPAAVLPADPGLFRVRQAWSTRIGDVGFPLSMAQVGVNVVLASTDGNVLGLDGATGRELWRVKLDSVAAGVGSDGALAAVVTRGNELVALREGREAWRRPLAAQVFTAPLVAGGRVFVSLADRSVLAFDAQSGARLWVLNRPAEALVLRQGGILTAVADTLVVGVGGRLVGVNPNNGIARWEVALANPRGVNEVERLVDLISGFSRLGDSVCLRAFQSAVGCVQAARGTLQWTKPANASNGVHGDATRVFGAEADGRLIAWRRDNGERSWVSESLLRQALSAPLALGPVVAVGDGAGLIHFFATESGQLLGRASTDGSAIVSNPIRVGDVMVVTTRNGGVFGFVPN